MVNFKQLNNINKSQHFRHFREKNLYPLFKKLTIGATLLISLWFILDLIFFDADITSFAILRAIAIAAFALNFAWVWLTKKRRIGLHIIIGFYIGAIFCSLLTIQSAAHDYIYWFGLPFLIIIWHMVLPFSYRLLFIHSLIFIAQFNVIMILNAENDIRWRQIILLNLVFLLVDFLASAISLGKNESAMNIFENQNTISDQVKKLESSNALLHDEILRREISEHLLEEQKKRLANIIEQIPTIIWSVDREGRFLPSEGSGLEKIGIAQGSHVGLFAHEVYRDNPVMLSFVERVLRNQIEHEIIYINNICLDTRVAKLLNEKGEHIGYTGVSLDVTENMKLHDELLRMSMVISQAPGGVITTDKEGLIQYINPYFCNTKKMKADDFLGKHISMIEDSSNAEVFSQMWGTINNGQTWKGVFQHKNGEINTWHTTIAAPYKDNSSEIKGFIVIQQDITELTNLGIKLQENEEKYRTLVEKSLDAIVISQNTKFIFVNKAFCDMLGYSAEELYSMNGIDILAPDEVDRMLEIHSKRMAGEMSTTRYNSAFIAKSGKRVYVEMSATTIQYNNAPSSFVTARDITARLEMEEALKSSEEKYRTLIEKATDAIIITQDGNFKFANPAFYKVLGYSEKDIIGKPFSLLVDEIDQARLADYHKRRMGGENFQLLYEAKAIAKDGSRRILELNSTSINLNSKPAAFIIMRDLTDRKKLEEAVKASENKYRKLFEAESDAIFLIEKLSGKILDVNPAASKIYGYTREEFLKLKNTDISAEPEKTKEATDKDSLFVPVRYHKKKTGEVFAVEISAGLTELENQHVQIVTVRDITMRIKMEEDLKISEKKYRDLADLLPQTIYELDVQGKLLYMNKAGLKAFLLTEKDLGRNASDFIVPEERNRMIENVRKTNEKLGQNSVNEYMALRTDGSTFPIMIYGDTMFENGVVAGSRGVIVDITERKKMEVALKKNEEQYRNLIQSLQEGMFVIHDNKFVFVNDAIVTMVGYGVEEIHGQSFLSVVAPECHNDVIKIHTKRMKGEEVPPYHETVLLHKDGETRIPVIISATLTTYNGMQAVIGTARDITDRKKWEKALQEANDKLEDVNKDLWVKVKERTDELTHLNTRLLKMEKENIQSQFEMLKQQVNPHFLFNSLNVLTSLIKLEPDLAEKFTEQLSKVYRYVLENKDKELVTLETELNFLNAYSFLIDIRFKDKLKVNINISNNYLDSMVLPLSLQLLIENAIKHNTFSRKSPLVVDVFVDDKNFLTVVNNLQIRESHFASTGVGLQNIKNRYLLLSDLEPVFEKSEQLFVAKIPLL